jgi:A/G-specific adenine glycosylase
LAAPPILPSAAWKQTFRRRLLTWYRRHRRHLPWRQSSDPYQIWISEIMLQQTQVSTVIPYFTRFIAAFPTVQSLALAPEHEVLRHWEGLGYYSRARQLHRAAKTIAGVHGGQLPRQADALQQLPGIGRYTAGAIASIAFDLPAPILEANTARLFSRLLAYRGDVRGAAGGQLLWQMATDVLPRRNVGTFNQALMELGSLVCAPRSPRCEVCPVSQLCPTFQSGQQELIPSPRTKPRIDSVREAAIVVWRRNRVLLSRRPPGERWAGLWDFPRFRVVAHDGPALRAELIAKVRDLAGVSIEPGAKLTTIRHGVTRFRITLDCHLARYVDGSHRQCRDAPWKWLTLGQLDNYPLSTTGRKISRLLVEIKKRGCFAPG